MTSYPDTEGAVRDWLRADVDIHDLVGNRVFFALPAQTQYPCVTVARAGGGDDPSEAPIDLAFIQVDVWGPLNNKAATTQVANTIRAACHQLRDALTVGSRAVLYGASVQSIVWLPDPADGRPRYAITLAVTARAAA